MNFGDSEIAAPWDLEFRQCLLGMGLRLRWSLEPKKSMLATHPTLAADDLPRGFAMIHDVTDWTWGSSIKEAV
jgi:hypothetical protein